MYGSMVVGVRSLGSIPSFVSNEVVNVCVYERVSCGLCPCVFSRYSCINGGGGKYRDWARVTLGGICHFNNERSCCVIRYLMIDILSSARMLTVFAQGGRLGG